MLDNKPFEIELKLNWIISCVVPDISLKFHENPFIRFSIIVLTIRDSENRKSILYSRG